MVANEAASHAAASSAIFELRGARIAVAIVDIHTSIAINRSGCGHPRHSLESIGEDDSCVHPSHQTAPVRQTERGTAVAAVQFLELLHALDPSTGNLTTAQLTKGVTSRQSRAAPAKPEHLRSWTLERSTQQGCSAVSSLSPSNIPSESIGEDDSRVHPSHQSAPVRQTERGTAVAAVQFLELLHALDPSTGNLTTAQLTKDVTPRAAPAKPEHLRSRTPARPEAIPAPEAASLAESAASAKPESQGDRPRRKSAEQHSAHTTEMDQHSAPSQK